MDIAIGIILGGILVAMFAGGMTALFNPKHPALTVPDASRGSAERWKQGRITIHITDPQEGLCCICGKPLDEPRNCTWVDFDKGKMAHGDCYVEAQQRQIRGAV